MIMKELDDIVNVHGVRHVFFFDDTFTLDRPRVMELCQAMIDKQLGITWKTETRVDLVDPELLALMKEAGCVSISFGIESGSDRVLKVIEKCHDVATAHKGIQMTKDAGIRDYRVHDNRHTHASHLVSSGQSLVVVGRLLGHTNPTTTQRYAHLADDPLRQAADIFGRKFAPT